MMPNYYDRERLAQAHFEELLCEAEQERLSALVARVLGGGPAATAQTGTGAGAAV